MKQQAEGHIPRVLAVGPYERHHLLDQLFLLITESYLSGMQVTCATPFDDDLVELGRTTQAYGPLLASEKFDVIWTVGGGVGGATLEFAFSRSAPRELYSEFQRSSSAEREEMLRRAAGHDARIVSPYIPNPACYPLNADAITVVNSVGIDPILHDPDRREEHVALLRGTTVLSVRDKESSDMLHALGLEHRLVPDAVHAIGRLRPAERNPDSDVAIIFILGDTLSLLGPAKVAAALTRSDQLRGLRLRVVHGGKSDKRPSEELAMSVKAQAPATDVEAVALHHPFEIVDHVSGARVVVTDEQHARIIACAYKVPRVSVWTYYDKSLRYHRFWDPDMPSHVLMADLDAAVARAIRTAERPEVRERADELARLAHENLEELAWLVSSRVASQTDEDLALRARQRITSRTRARP